MASNVSIGGVPHGGFSIGAIGGPFTENEILFGKADGTIEQDPNFKWDGTRLDMKGPNDDSIIIGNNAANGITTATNIIAIGKDALRSLTGGSSRSIAIGRDSLGSLQSGTYNHAVGYRSLNNVTTSSFNVAFGGSAGTAITTGSGNNIAIGIASFSKAVFGSRSATGSHNIAMGTSSLGAGYQNSTGSYNVGIGRNTLYNFTSGSNNIAIGRSTLNTLSSGVNNVAIGTLSGDQNNSTNTISIGYNSGRYAGNNTISIGNVANPVSTEISSIFIGDRAGQTIIAYGTENIAIGKNAMGSAVGSGSYGIFIGSYTGSGGTTGDRNIGIGPGVMSAFAVSGYDNIGIGSEALRDVGVGYRNIAIGERALKSSSSGDRNIAIGDGCLENINGASRANVAIGGQAGYSLDGDDNVLIGIGAGSVNLAGDGNVLIGRSAGNALLAATKNVIIGYYATTPAVTDDNMLILANSSTGRSLVRGSFSSSYFLIHGETRLANDLVGGAGHVARHAISDTITMSGATADSAITIPVGATLIGVSFWVTLAVTTSGATDTWDADFITGSTTSLVTGGLGAFGTKENIMVVSEVTSAGTKVRFDAPGAETFTAGLIQIMVYYETLTSMD